MTSELAVLDREAAEFYGEVPRPHRGGRGPAKGRSPLKRKSRRIPDENREAHILALRAEGRTLEEIGALYGITRERVRQLVARVTPGGGSRASVTTLGPLAVVAYARSDAAASVAGVAKHFGSATGVVRDMLRALGVLDALLRLYRRREWRMRHARQQGAIAKIQAFAAKHGVPYAADFGIGGQTKGRHPDLPNFLIFGSYTAMFRAAGLTPREKGTHGHRQPRGQSTHCKHGHERTPENTYEWHGKRSCRACDRVRNKAEYQRKKARASTQPLAGS